MGNLDVNSGVILINWHFRGSSAGNEGTLTFFQGAKRERGNDRSLTEGGKWRWEPCGSGFPDHYREYFCNLL